MFLHTLGPLMREEILQRGNDKDWLARLWVQWLLVSRRLTELGMLEQHTDHEAFMYSRYLKMYYYYQPRVALLQEYGLLA